jgi:NADPH2:quinone reductase
VRKPDPFPCIPGVEAVGVVEEVGEAVRGRAPGQVVVAMMQGLGGVRAERPGGYTEFVTVPAEAVASVPPAVEPVQMAAVGLVGVTAHEGLRKLGPLAGRRVLVTGAAGGVGSAAIARAQGASVVGLVSRAEQADYVRRLGADEVAVSPRAGPAALDAGSFDGVLEAVAGGLFGTCAAALREGGVLSLVGAVGGGDVAFGAWQLIRPVTLTGYSTEALDGPALREAVAALAGWLARGAIRPPDHRPFPLAEAASAHRLIERGGVNGRVLLRPAGPGLV